MTTGQPAVPGDGAESAKTVLIDDGRLAGQQAGVVDCVFDLVGNSVLRDSLPIVRSRGRVCQLGFLGGLEPVADLPSGVQFSFYGSAFALGTSATWTGSAGAQAHALTDPLLTRLTSPTSKRSPCSTPSPRAGRRRRDYVNLVHDDAHPG